MLRARGREETLILGSESLKPIVRELLPEAEIVTRPRFSTLRYSGSVKLSRLPPRSAVVAFSAEQVYALAEMLRRFRGGAAVVMGALSPATRNAQVAMFQRGEVDYLVATDAIGMGLNMDVSHVAFAGLEKFDGRRDRRLTIAEMAQIAGRAGRHQKDGTFGTLGLTEESGGFSDSETEAIEEHRFRPIDWVYWRNADLDFTDVRALIASLEEKPDDPVLRPAPEAIDLAVLKLIAEDPSIPVKKAMQARRLWAVCGLPDFRKVGPMHHARMVRRLFSYIGEGGHVPHEWFAAEVTRLDNMSGDIEALADRLAGIRSWAYIAHRADWLKEPAKWAERTREVEARLSDALHERLTQRFVDRRTAVLVRDIGARGSDALPVTVAADGEVSVGPEPIGHSPASSSGSIPPRDLPTSGFCSPPPNAASGKSSTAAPKRWSKRPTRFRSCRRGRGRRCSGVGGPHVSRAYRRDDRCSSRRCGPRGRSIASPPRPGPPFGRGSNGGSTRRSRTICARSGRSPRPQRIPRARPGSGRSPRC